QLQLGRPAGRDAGDQRIRLERAQGRHHGPGPVAASRPAPPLSSTERTTLMRHRYLERTARWPRIVTVAALAAATSGVIAAGPAATSSRLSAGPAPTTAAPRSPTPPRTCSRSRPTTSR